MTQLRRLDDLRYIDPQELNQPAVLQQVTALTRDSYTTYEADEIDSAILSLEQAVELVDDELGKNWKLRPSYEKLLALLRFGLLIVRFSEKDVREVLTGNLIFFLKEEPDLRERFRSLVFVQGDYNMAKRKELLNILTVNREQLAGHTVEEWLKDYNNTVGASQRGGLTQVSYLNQSQLAKSLHTTEDREILLNLLQTYDWLREGGALPVELIVPERKLTAVGRERVPHAATVVTGKPEADIIAPASNASPVTVSAPVALAKPLAVSATPVATPPVEVTRSTFVPPLKPVPQVMKSAQPAFLFDETDEREADRYREQMANSKWRMAGSLEGKLRTRAEEVVKERNFSFKDEVSHKRFVQLFVSFLKDVRDVIETREMLLKSTDSGGLGLTSDKTEKVMEILEQAKKEFESRIKNQELRTEETKPLDSSADSPRFQNDKVKQVDITSKPKTELDKMIEAEAVALEHLNTPKNVTGVTSTGQAGTLEQKSEILHSVQNDKTRQNLEINPEKLEVTRQQILQEIVGKIEAEKPQAVGSIELRTTGQEGATRPRLMDIKAPPRVLGPVEELRTLSMVDFRRLAKEPVEVLNKISKKIDIIGETSVGKRVEAVRAWQNSPVYQLYLKIGRQSIDSGKSVVDIIAEYTSQGEVVLSEGEFNAIVDFNERIRF